MPIERAAGLRRERTSGPAGTFPFLCAAAIVCALCIAGCASPGEPYERKAPVPTAITNLAAEQHGDAVVLTFNMPKESVERRPLKEAPEVEIFRAFSPPTAASGGASSSPPSPRPKPVLCGTIPASDLEKYGERGYVRYAVELRPEDLACRAGWIAEYTVRTRTSGHKESADSNFVDLAIYPAAKAINDLSAGVTPSGIILRWSAPQKTSTAAAPQISTYRIYRADRTPAPPAAASTPEKNSADAEGAASNLVKPARETSGAESPLLKIGESETTEFRDAQAEFGRTYVYSVRGLVQYPSEMLESADSNLVEVRPKDVFPPAAPLGLIVVLVPEEGETPATLDLSWAISPETDVAGYDVYRSEQEGVLGTRQNQELLLTPAFRDMNAKPGYRYFYSVTAIDRAGNESQPSAPVSSGVPAEN